MMDKVRMELNLFTYLSGVHSTCLSESSTKAEQLLLRFLKATCGTGDMETTPFRGSKPTAE